MKIKKLTILAFCAGAFLLFVPKNALAATQVNNVDLTVENQLRADANDTSPLNHGHNYHKVKFNISVNQPVHNGDFFEIETHAFPMLGSRDIFANGNSTTPIGKITQVIEDIGARNKQFQHQPQTPEFDAIRPENARIVKYKIVFNENAENLNDIKFNFGSNGIQENSALADRDYVLNHRVTLNGVEKYSKDTPVNKVNKSSIKKNVIWHYRTVLDGDEQKDDRKITAHFGYEAKEDLFGSIVEITLPEDSPLVFNQSQPVYKNKEVSSFIFDDSNYINQHGVIADSRDAFLESEIVKVEDRKIQIRINNQSKASISSGISRIAMSLTQEGAEFLKNNNDLPPIPYTMTIKKDGTPIFNQTNNGKPIIKGSTNDFSSTVKQPELKQPEEPTKDELPGSKSEEIQTPNTGMKNNSFEFLYVIFGGIILTGASVQILKK